MSRKTRHTCPLCGEKTIIHGSLGDQREKAAAMLFAAAELLPDYEEELVAETRALAERVVREETR